MKKNGFTLTELLASIVIIAILISIAVPIYFNVSKSTKENEYTSKKQYLESMAQRYAEENSIDNGYKISVSRLVATGYAGAEKYVEVNGQDIPFISNPKDEEDNLACHVVTLNVENYEVSATVSDTSDCDFAESEIAGTKLGIRAFEFTNNTIGEELTYETYNKFNWTNKDVLVVVDPKIDNYKSLTISTSGQSKLVDKDYMLKNPVKNSNININDYTNIIIINASVISKQSINVSVELESTIASTSVTVQIDKESPAIDTKTFSGWITTNNGDSKGATIFISDGAGSGAKGLYVSEVNDFSQKDPQLKPVGDDDVVSIRKVNEELLKNKRYYLWAEDKAGNISPVSTYFDISNIDNDEPKVSNVTISTNKNGYNSINVTVNVFGTDDSGSGVTEACIKASEGYDGCNWQPFGNGSYVNTNFNLPGNEGSGTTYTIYAYLKDAVGNISKKVYKTATYKIYTKCSILNTGAWGGCSAKCDGGTQTRAKTDAYLGGVCAYESQTCNSQGCCSSTTPSYGAYGSCSGNCGSVGTMTRTVTHYSSYNGQYCGVTSESASCNTAACRTFPTGLAPKPPISVVEIIPTPTPTPTPTPAPTPAPTPTTTCKDASVSYSCDSGWKKDGKKCKKTASISTSTYGCGTQTTGTNCDCSGKPDDPSCTSGGCWTYTGWSDTCTSYSCPSGYKNVNNSSCVQTKDAKKSYSCDSGWKKDGTKCCKTS